MRVRAARAFVMLAALAFPLAVAAQSVYYRWVDANGKVQFSDKPPVGFKGEVSKVAIDAPAPPAATPTPPKAAAPKAPAVSVDEEVKAPDLATRRRKDREAFETRLKLARTNLAAAKKALEEGEGAGTDERQFVRQNFGRNERSPEKTPPPRGNCMADRASTGQAIWNCPRSIPNEAYFERQKQLEEAVKKAEDEVEEAERAYRRGVD